MIDRLGRLGLQRRIMLYVTGGLLVVMAAYSAVSLQAVRQSTALVFRERLIVASTVARQADEDLSDLQSELNSVADVVGTDLTDGRMADAYAAMRSLRQYWSAYDSLHASGAVILTDSHGSVLWSDAPTTEAQPSSTTNVPVFQATLRLQGPAMADEYLADSSGHGSLWLAAPATVSGKFQGVLLGELDLSHVSERFAALMQAQTSAYSLELINQQGIILAATDARRRWTVSDHLPLVKGLLGQEQAGSATHAVPASSNGPAHILAFVPLRTVPWGVTLEEPQDAALALPHALQGQLLWFGGIVLLAGLVLAWVTTRAVVQPVNALIGATQRISAGDLDHPLDRTAEDEVGRLARAFDDMRLDLQHSRAEIARWNRELEERVHQRTRELTALVESSHTLAAALDPDKLFENLITETREVLPSAEGIAFFLLDPTSDSLSMRSTYGFDTAECGPIGFQLGEGIVGKVFEARSPMRLGLPDEIREAQSNMSAENAACFRHATGGREIQSALGAPLVSKGNSLGALVLYNFSREEAFGENDTSILQAFADQAAAAIENARLYASLREKEAALAALLGQVIQAQEEERARVARELHDELGQLLTRLSINLKMYETQVIAEPGRAAETLASTQALVWQTMEQAHRLVVELRPILLDELGLEAALREELTTRLESRGITTRLETRGTPERLPGSVEITVFRIAQEAISNISQHSHAQHATVTIHANGALELTILDDGVGIPADWHSEATSHRPLGLLGMQERAGLIGGSLTVEPEQPHGTRVTLRVPLEGWQRGEGIT